MTYNWQFPTWPIFDYEAGDIQSIILAFAQETGEVSGVLQALSDDLKQEAWLQLMLVEAIKTSEIEGEFISRIDVMSSIRNQLVLNDEKVNVKDLRAGNIAQLLLEVRKSFAEPLTAVMLQNWHSILMADVKEAQQSLEVTNWVNYFGGVILEAQRDAKAMVQLP